MQPTQFSESIQLGAPEQNAAKRLSFTRYNEFVTFRVTRPQVQAAREQIRSSRDAIYRTQARLVRNRHVTEHMFVLVSGELAGRSPGAPQSKSQHALMIERLTAQLTVFEQVLSTSSEVLRASWRILQRMA